MGIIYSLGWYRVFIGIYGFVYGSFDYWGLYKDLGDKETRVKHKAKPPF